LRSGAVSKPRPVPDTKTWNEDINFGLHVNAPLSKHFVGSCPVNSLVIVKQHYFKIDALVLVLR
jgi:hypothetical protein